MQKQKFVSRQGAVLYSELLPMGCMMVHHTRSFSAKHALACSKGLRALIICALNTCPSLNEMQCKSMLWPYSMARHEVVMATRDSRENAGGQRTFECTEASSPVSLWEDVTIVLHELQYTSWSACHGLAEIPNASILWAMTDLCMQDPEILQVW